ncbi:DUF7344 domain-containing protein [Haloprofundus halobius]|uniref:DUF7344 domain-containing protein n=1 Tax=Haloprofundus halobius TaxID=2876194 RepID=UPI001CCEEDC2|nr:hypothetical protein [Haloprofundus halobius]
MTYDNSRTTDPIRPAIELDGVFATLASATRRHVLLGLLERSPREERAVSEELAVAWGVERAHVRTQLRHVHLPKLAVSGHIEWNEVTGEIARGPTFDDLAPLLRLLDDHAVKLPGVWP